MARDYGLLPLPRNVKDLQRLAEAQGWTCEKTTGGHHKWTSPDGQIVGHSGTPSDWRAIDNFRAELKRKGLRPYMPQKEEKKLEEPKTVVSRVAGDSTTPVPPVGGIVKKKRQDKGGRGRIRGVLLDILHKRDRPQGLGGLDILEEVQKTLPLFTAKDITHSLHFYASKGDFVNIGHGRYRISSAAKLTTAAADDVGAVFEEALAALAKLERVVKSLREEREKINAAKAAINAIK